MKHVCVLTVHTICMAAAASTYRLYTDRIQTVYRVYTDCIQTVYRLYTECIQTVYTATTQTDFIFSRILIVF